MSEKYGPNTAQVEAYLAILPTLTAGQWVAARDAAWVVRRARVAAWDAAWDAARDASRDASWDATRDAAWVAARDAAWVVRRARDAARAAEALVVRDLITPEHFDTLTAPMRAAGIDFGTLTGDQENGSER
jgi:hypothetical protein